MQTYGNVFGDREESGLVLFLPIYTHTCTLFPRKMVWLPSIIKRCVLCGACCLCKKSTSIRDHLSSFEAILILFLFFYHCSWADGGVGFPSFIPLSAEEFPRGAAPQGQSGCVWHCSAIGDMSGELQSRELCPTLSWGPRE